MTDRQAQVGDTVAVHYDGTLSDGRVFDSSAERDPIEFTIGSGQVIAGFEQTVTGMSVGDSRTVTIEPHDAYGDHQPELVHVLERERLPDGLTLEIGSELEATGPDGSKIRLRVIAVDESVVHLDANHPLAGEALTFEINLVSIAD